MPTDEWGPETSHRTGITGDDAVPSASGDGVDYGVDQGNWDEIWWHFSAASESDTATIQFWYYSELLDDFGKGNTTTDITGSTDALTYTRGKIVAVQMTSVTGTWEITTAPIRKKA